MLLYQLAYSFIKLVAYVLKNFTWNKFFFFFSFVISFLYASSFLLNFWNYTIKERLSYCINLKEKKPSVYALIDLNNKYCLIKNFFFKFLYIFFSIITLQVVIAKTFNFLFLFNYISFTEKKLKKKNEKKKKKREKEFLLNWWECNEKYSNFL